MIGTAGKQQKLKKNSKNKRGNGNGKTCRRKLRAYYLEADQWRQLEELVYGILGIWIKYHR